MLAKQQELLDIERRLAKLPKGSLTYKTIKGKKQPYLQWTEHGKSFCVYIKINEREEILALIDEREQLKEQANRLRAYLKQMQTLVDFRCEVIDGVIYDMTTSPNYRHGQVNGNIFSKLHYELRNSLCKVFIDSIDFRYNKATEDYLLPDILLCCDSKNINGGQYFGCPKFIVESLSPSTRSRDLGVKKDIYEKCGVEELWIIEPIEEIITIYHLINGSYQVALEYTHNRERSSSGYNSDATIRLRSFPIEFTLGEIFAL